MLWREHGGHGAVALRGRFGAEFGRKVAVSGTGDFLERRAEGLLYGIGNYRRALGQKDLGNWGFWYSSVWISSCVRSLVSGDSRGWCVDTWVVSNVTPPPC